MQHCTKHALVMLTIQRWKENMFLSALNECVSGPAFELHSNFTNTPLYTARIPEKSSDPLVAIFLGQRNLPLDGTIFSIQMELIASSLADSRGTKEM